MSIPLSGKRIHPIRVAWEMGRWIMSNRSYSQVVLDATEEYIEHLKSLPTNQLPSPRDAASELMSRTVDEIELENSVKVRSQKFPVPRNLSLVQVAMLVPVYFKVVRISCAGESTDESRDLLGVYQTDEPNMGLYATDDEQSGCFVLTSQSGTSRKSRCICVTSHLECPVALIQITFR